MWLTGTVRIGDTYVWPTVDSKCGQGNILLVPYSSDPVHAIARKNEVPRTAVPLG